MKRYHDESYLKTQLKNGKTYLVIAKENKIGRSTVQRALHKYGLTKPSLDWSKKEIFLLRKNYGKIQNITKLFPDRTMNSIYHKANRLGLIGSKERPRKYAVNEDFFKSWNKEMAYVLGWMFSDGNVCSDERTFRIKLAVKDKQILQKIRIALKSKAPIVISSQLLPSKKGYRSYVTLRINSRIMTNDLIKLGCVPNKVNKFTVPAMPLKLQSHFVRGYFDGDGSISFNKPNTIRLRIVGSNRYFVLRLAKIFKNSLRIPTNFKKTKKGKRLWQCDYYGDNARKICRWLYQDCGSYYLKRKWTRYKNHLRKRSDKRV